MNDREIGEIRRRARKDRSNMTAIYGCYVNGNKEIISSFRRSVGMMLENEAEKYFQVFKRILSGAIGKNLIDISFRTAQVADSPEHKFLMELRKTALQDDELRMQLYQKIIAATSFEDSFLILAGCDSYDVPFKSKDDETQVDASGEVFTYIQCAICPVKQTKPTLQYIAEEKEFHDGGIAQVVAAPELGFMFPAFDGRTTNIYNALYYTHSAKISNQPLVDALFNVQAPQPAEEQKKNFQALLTTSLENQCSLDVVQTVHDYQMICPNHLLYNFDNNEICEKCLEGSYVVTGALKECGVPEQNVAKFSVEFDQTFGHDAQLHPRNLINSKRFEIETPDVSIKVNPERSDLIETRIIGGVKYILICADENVEVNGVRIHIADNNN